MKARFVLGCAAAGVAASALIGPTASADQFTGTIGFAPDVVEPGYEVEINGTCSDPNRTTAPVISLGLEPVSLVRKEVIPDHDSRFALTARAKVKPDAAPGNYPVSFTCGTETVTGYLRVAAEEAPPLLKPSIFIAPKQDIAGKNVTISVICADLEPVTSAALTIGSAKPLAGGGEGQPYFEVAAKVKNVKPGVYKVSTKCDGKPISTTFTVLPSDRSPAKAQVPVKPKKAPETGDA